MMRVDKLLHIHGELLVPLGRTSAAICSMPAGEDIGGEFTVASAVRMGRDTDSGYVRTSTADATRPETGYCRGCSRAAAEIGGQLSRALVGCA